MHSARMTANHKLEDIYPHGFWAETKLDGWRCQLRKVDGVLQLFSRSGRDYSETFRSVLDAIMKDKLLTVDNCVVDGEILTWHKVRRVYGLCSSLTTVAKTALDPTGDRDVQLVVRLWDVMHINHEQLMEFPLETRRERLRKIVINTDVLRVVEPLVLDRECLLHTWIDMTRLLKEALDRSEEGLVLKDPSSTYKPGARKLEDWIKIKPDYFQKGTQEYDLILVGASGDRKKPSGDFLVALAEDPPAGADKPKFFHTLTHVGRLNAKETRAVNEIVAKHMTYVDLSSKNISLQNTTDVSFKRMNVGTERQYTMATWAATAELEEVQVCYSGKRQENCDWVIDPRRSIIITVKADHRVIPTNEFSMKHTLRFARLHEKGLRVYRPDLGIEGDAKPWWDCMLVSDWGSIVEASLDPATTTGILMSFDKIANTKRVKPSPQVQAVQSFRKYHGNGEKNPDGVLANYVIHVLSCDPLKQKELEEMAAGMGARVMACDPLSGKIHMTFPAGTTFIRIGTETSSHRFLTCQRLDRDLVGTSWLRDCMHASDCPPELHPKYMLNTSAELKAIFDSKFDILDGLYTTELLASSEQLDEILNNDKVWEEMSLHSDGGLSDGQLCAEEDLLSDGEDPAWSVFKGVVALIVPLDPTDACELALARARLIAGGAMISPSTDHAYAVTHIVVVWSRVRPPHQSPTWLSIECMDFVRAALPSTEPYTHKRPRRQVLDTKWVVVSTAWVEKMAGV